MSVFDFDDYREFLQTWRKQLPKRGWGFVNQLAGHLGISQVQVSQVLGGTKEFTLEQAISVSDYLSLSDSEKEYFLWLVIRAKSGTEKLTRFSSNRLKQMSRQAKQIKAQLPADVELSEEQRETFYSNHLYSAVRLFTSIHDGKTLEEICAHFQISPARASKILDFLLAAGLVVKGKMGRFVMGAKRTVVERESPHFARHMINWRLLALQAAPSADPGELLYTSPASVSRKDFELIQKKLLQTIKDISAQVQASPAEMVVCWNLDWFELKP